MRSDIASSPPGQIDLQLLQIDLLGQDPYVVWLEALERARDALMFKPEENGNERQDRAAGRPKRGGVRLVEREIEYVTEQLAKLV